MAPTRRQWLGGIAASAVIAALADTTAWARETSGWPAVTPPVTSLVPHPIAQLGRTRDDPYAWMKYVPAQGTREMATMPPTIRQHLLAERAYADAVLAPLHARRDALLAQMLARAGEGGVEPSIAVGGWRYRQFIPAGQAHPRHVRQPAAGGPDEVLLDETDRAAGQPYYRSTEHQPSPDGRYFAWAEDVIGNDRHRLCVRDNTTGKVSVVVPADAYGYGGVTFSPSSRWLFWIWRDARNRPTRLYRTAVAGGPAALVYEERDPSIFMAVRRTAADGYVALMLSGPDTAEVRLVAASAETATPRLVFARRPNVRYEVDEWRGGLTLLTDADGALDRKLLLLSRETLAPVETLVPHRPGREILSVLPFGTALVRLERADGMHRLVIRQVSGAETAAAFPGPVYALELPTGQAFDAATVRVVYQAPNRPREWIDVALADGAQTLVAREKVAGFASADYRVERLFARAPDGEQVPITLLSRADAPRGADRPLLLYGYGAYGISSDPLFSIPATVLVDQGWTYAIAHVRGGSEKGRRWFLDGRKFHKRNSFTDFVACANHLCRQGYTRHGKVVAYGLSAGGLLVGASMNIAPTLWGGVIAKVPFVDMLNTMSDADHPLVPLFRPDWGDPLADPRAYDYIASISPYENVRAAAYPPLLCTAGLKDDRVSYWEPAKLVAAVRRRSTSGNPAVLLLDPDSGHQGSAGRRAEFGELALFWAFADKCLA